MVDHYCIHEASPVHAFLAGPQDAFELVFLPTPSPELNPVECFWKYLCRQVTHHHVFQAIERLTDAVISFFHEMAAAPDIVCRVAALAT